MGSIRLRVGDCEMKTVRSHAEEVVVEAVNVSGVVSVKLKNLTLKRDGNSWFENDVSVVLDCEGVERASKSFINGTSSAAASFCA